MKEEQAHTLRHWWKRWGCGMADLVADFIGKVKVKSAQQQAGRDLATRLKGIGGNALINEIPSR
jgi:hypothetical protein